MMTEWLDIVDQNDIVIGRAPRDEIHARNHLHRSAHVMVFNSKGEAFVQLRSMRKDNSPGLWDTSAAGHVDSGESYLECAVREVEEELGVKTTAESLTFVAKLMPKPDNGFEHTRIYTLVSDQSLTLQAEEIDDGRWRSVRELDAWIERNESEFTGTFVTIWQLVRSQV